MLQPFGVGEVEIGVQILFDKWGKGYGTECVGAALDYIFDSSEIERVLAVVHVENEPSKKMVTRCGMVEEGFVMHAKLPHIRYIISRS
jgi:ribosomal-protein-alanine N-acetyltransferase